MCDFVDTGEVVPAEDWWKSCWATSAHADACFHWHSRWRRRCSNRGVLSCWKL